MDISGIMTSNKYILFDLGGIFIPDNTKLLNRAIAAHVGIPEGEMANRWTKALPELFTGRMKIIDFYENQFGGSFDPRVLLQMHLDIYTRGFQIDSSMLDLLQRLNLSHTTACLTNTEIEVSNVNSELGLYTHFQYKFLSVEMHMMKPNEDIFMSAVQKLNAPVKDIIFIDDKEENINTGSLLGLKTILFESADKTKEMLRELKA
jgi:HAD superfamily hydrolase (TIGR01509 family)